MGQELNPNCRQILLVEKAQKFNKEHRHLFRDDVYGVDIELALILFAKECIKEYNEAKPNSNRNS